MTSHSVFHIPLDRSAGPVPIQGEELVQGPGHQEVGVTEPTLKSTTQSLEFVFEQCQQKYSYGILEKDHTRKNGETIISPEPMD